jgi:hypothetical protein
MTPPVTDIERLRRPLAANSAQVEDHLLPMFTAMAGPILARMDLLADSDFGATEPFDPARRLLADADPSLDPGRSGDA